MVFDCISQDNNLETGGILIGPKQHNRIVTDIIPSTIYAERKSTTYFQSEKDVQILNQNLAVFQNRGFDFKGYYHKHPPNFHDLSAGDKNTCREILLSKNYHINNHLIMCILTKSSVHPFPLFSYFVSLENENTTVSIKNSEIKILPKVCLEECAQCFENSQSEVSDEDIYPKQHIGRNENQVPSKIIRNSTRKHYHIKLTLGKTRSETNRSVSS